MRSSPSRPCGESPRARAAARSSPRGHAGGLRWGHAVGRERGRIGKRTSPARTNCLARTCSGPLHWCAQRDASLHWLRSAAREFRRIEDQTRAPETAQLGAPGARVEARVHAPSMVLPWCFHALSTPCLRPVASTRSRARARDEAREASRLRSLVLQGFLDLCSTLLVLALVLTRT